MRSLAVAVEAPEPLDASDLSRQNAAIRDACRHHLLSVGRSGAIRTTETPAFSGSHPKTNSPCLEAHAGTGLQAASRKLVSSAGQVGHLRRLSRCCDRPDPVDHYPFEYSLAED